MGLVISALAWTFGLAVYDYGTSGNINERTFFAGTMVIAFAFVNGVLI